MASCTYFLSTGKLILGGRLDDPMSVTSGTFTSFHHHWIQPRMLACPMAASILSWVVGKLAGQWEYQWGSAGEVYLGLAEPSCTEIHRKREGAQHRASTSPDNQPPPPWTGQGSGHTTNSTLTNTSGNILEVVAPCGCGSNEAHVNQTSAVGRLIAQHVCSANH